MKVNFAARSGGLMATITTSLVLGLTSYAFGQTRIMCLGDSITQGHDIYASYRYPLWFSLVDAGYQVDFVGSQDSNCDGNPVPDVRFYPEYYGDFHRQHEGRCGYTTRDYVEDEDVMAITSAADPDIVLIHLGTNDVGLNGAAGLTDVQNFLPTIINEIRSAEPNVEIFIAKVIPIGPGTTHYNNAARIMDLNNLLTQIVLNDNSPGSPPLRLVDQYSGFESRSMSYDGLHPNTAGERRMAEVWRVALAGVLGPAPACIPIEPIPSNNTLIGLYTFDNGTVHGDGTILDVSGASNLACVDFGNPQFVSGGYEGNGLSLDGASYVRGDITIGPLNMPQLTMGAWVRPYSLSTGQALISHDNGGFDRTLGILDSATASGWICFTGTGSLGYLTVQHLEWQFVAATYDDTNDTVSLYVDGVLVLGTGSPGSGFARFRIGQNPNCTPYDCTFAGIVDNVFIMSEALDIQRLDEIMNGGYRRIPTCPVFVQQPACAEVCSGNVASFAVDAAGSELIQPLTFQWRKEGLPLFDGGNVSGATSPELSLSSVLLADAGLYDCVVTNGCGSAFSNAVQLAVIGSIPGDGNGDGATDGLDIAGFVNALLSGSPGPGAALCAYDLNMDAVVSAIDLPLFVNLLLGS